MKVLYAAFRHDPRDPIASSSVDFGFFCSISSRAASTTIFGPFLKPAPLPDRVLKRAYESLTGKRFIKWDLSTILRSSILLNRTVEELRPDVVFTIFPASLARYDGNAPVVFCTDLTFQAWQEHGAGFGQSALRFLVWLERQAVNRSALIIAHSEWGKKDLVTRHGVAASKIRILTMPAAISADSVPKEIDIRTTKHLYGPLKLLLVGRDYHRKGVDIALEVVRILNVSGCAAELTVCGVTGPASPNVRFVGPFKKSIAEELDAYVGLYRASHFLLHPARFEPAGIVPSEAAAFGTPTITNETGGLATTVKHDVSGVVLPKGSPAVAYADAIRALVDDPERYYALCESSRKRYEEELNWTVAGDRLASILQEAIELKRSQSVG